MPKRIVRAIAGTHENTKILLAILVLILAIAFGAITLGHFYFHLF